MFLLVICLFILLARLGRLDWFGDMLKGLGQRHATYGVRPEHYPLVGVVLLETFADFLGKHWTQAGTPPSQILLANWIFKLKAL
jgi:hemoglobin-like flavoprotein